MATDNTDFSEMLGSLLSNPGIMSQISSIASQMKTKNINEESREPETAEDTGSAPENTVDAAKEGKNADRKESGDLGKLLAPLLGDLKNPGKHRADTEKRNALLKALKPYLSRERCEAIDYFIKIGSVGEILGNIVK